MSCPEINKLISHRLRGFDTVESSLKGLETALTAGVLHVEVDIKKTADSVLILFHDQYLKTVDKNRIDVSSLTLSAIKKLAGPKYDICKLEQFLSLASEHANIDSHFYLDIKDPDIAVETLSLVSKYNLQKRVTYVSWLPSVLYNVHELIPQAKLCLSHFTTFNVPFLFSIIKTIGRFLHPLPSKLDTEESSKIRRMYYSPDGIISQQILADQKYTVDATVIKNTLKGEMLKMLARTQGGICIPKQMANHALVQYYQSKGIFVSTFSHSQTKALCKQEQISPRDFYFVDSRSIFNAATK